MTAPHTDTRYHILDTARTIVGRKGFSAVGLTEILKAASVPKGSFYHYFSSKEAFGEALLRHYFDEYLMRIDAIYGIDSQSAAERFMLYWAQWRAAHIQGDVYDHCLAVKLGAEVCDLSDGMRRILSEGTAAVAAKLARFVVAGQQDGSLTIHGRAEDTAMVLYQMWLGATLLAKFTRDAGPFDRAMATTRRILDRPE